jgi:DNA-binding CsgD family transcriptional regulator
MGIPGVGEVEAGTHLCALYSGPSERDELLFPFLQEGMREGDKCLCLIDDAEPATVRGQVEGWPVSDTPPSEQLDVDRASAVYRHSGRFSVTLMTSFLAEALTQAADEAFPLLRAAGEMSWVLPHPAARADLFAYESAVNHVVADMPALFMCMYDLERCGVTMLVDVLKTHPMVLLGRTVLENPHYLAPNEYVADDEASPTPRRYALAKVPRRRNSTTTSDSWRSLTEAELRVAELVAGGMTNRKIAAFLTLSPHTVDAHLKHIYAKLTIHSRVELTVLALEHRMSATL